MARKAKVDYDEENDVLWVFVGEKVKDSLEIDNFIIDFSHENKVVGVEILDASEIISKLSQTEISKEMLSEIKEASINFIQSKELFFIIIGLLTTINKVQKEIPIQVPAPRVAIAA